ncbi:MAG: AtpZ/AtpI family protein [bacterium]
MKKPRPKQSDPFLLAFGIYGGVGFQLAASVVGGLLLGGYADKRWGTGPWLTMTGLILGAIGGFYNLIKILNWNQGRRERRTGRVSGQGGAQ